MKRKKREPGDPATLKGRMRLAAEAAGLKSEGVAERLAPRLGGLTGAAVRKWWLGMSEPPFSVLEAYAEELSCSLYWLITGKTDPSELFAHLAVAVEELHRAVAAGEPAPAAWERILGQSDLLEPDERRVLIVGEPGVGKTALLARSLAGFQLTPKQSQLVQELVEELSPAAAEGNAGRARGREPKP